jgi:hypothetical protein
MRAIRVDPATYIGPNATEPGAEVREQVRRVHCRWRGEERRVQGVCRESGGSRGEGEKNEDQGDPMGSGTLHV